MQRRHFLISVLGLSAHASGHAWADEYVYLAYLPALNLFARHWNHFSERGFLRLWDLTPEASGWNDLQLQFGSRQLNDRLSPGEMRDLPLNQLTSEPLENIVVSAEQPVAAVIESSLPASYPGWPPRYVRVPGIPTVQLAHFPSLISTTDAAMLTSARLEFNTLNRVAYTRELLDRNEVQVHVRNLLRKRGRFIIHVYDEQGVDIKAEENLQATNELIDGAHFNLSPIIFQGSDQVFGRTTVESIGFDEPPAPIDVYSLLSPKGAPFRATLLPSLTPADFGQEVVLPSLYHSTKGTRSGPFSSYIMVSPADGAQESSVPVTLEALAVNQRTCEQRNVLVSLDPHRDTRLPVSIFGWREFRGGVRLRVLGESSRIGAVAFDYETGAHMLSSDNEDAFRKAYNFYGGYVATKVR